MINGQRTSFTNVTLDGINIQDNYIRTNAVDFSPNLLLVDQVGEMTISTSNTNPAFGNASLSDTQAKYLTSIVADWRYVIPDNPAVQNGPTHPVLYASAESGVYRSVDDGLTWALFPNVAFDGAPSDGGQLPKAHVTDLNLALGRIDPTTGRAVAQPGDPNTLLATTFGRGTFSIRLAPIVFPNTQAQPNNIRLDPSVSAGVASGQSSQSRLPLT